MLKVNSREASSLTKCPVFGGVFQGLRAPCCRRRKLAQMAPDGVI